MIVGSLSNVTAIATMGRSNGPQTCSASEHLNAPGGVSGAALRPVLYANSRPFLRNSASYWTCWITSPEQRTNVTRSLDRKSVAEGSCVSVMLDSGGVRTTKHKNIT